MALNNAHPDFHPDLTGNALHVYARGYGILHYCYMYTAKYERQFVALRES